MIGSILSAEERSRIRNECRRRYRTVDRAVERGADAAKAYGNWAGPTIEALLDTCDALEQENKNLRAMRGEAS
jgi:hypothetical protein